MTSLLIKNGTIVDPAQKLCKSGNVYLCDGKIKSILQPEEQPEADCIIDATGKIVCPGFVDIHMHEDLYDKAEGRLHNSVGTSMLLMGVTTALGGNCGENKALPSLYLDKVDEEGYGVNLALLAGHWYIRTLESGGVDRKYDPVSGEVLKKMKAVCIKQLEAGCMGISFGLKYVPGTTWEEISTIAGLCKSEGLLISAHVRDDVAGVFDAAKELANIAREGLRVQFSHIGSMGGYGQMGKLLAQIEGYRKEGLDYMCDCYPYDAFSTQIGNTTYDEGFLQSYDADYSAILIGSGKYAGQICTEEIFRELRAEEPDTITIGKFMKEKDIDLAYEKDYVMVGSDGFRDGAQGHPRAAGAFPRFFCKYVKSGKLSLEEGIARMSTKAAERLNLPSKGNLKPGSDGDIVIFDYNKIEDRATYEEPTLPPSGIDYVLIGGKIAARDGKVVNDRLGKAVRRRK